MYVNPKRTNLRSLTSEDNWTTTPSVTTNILRIFVNVTKTESNLRKNMLLYLEIKGHHITMVFFFFSTGSLVVFCLTPDEFHCFLSLKKLSSQCQNFEFDPSFPVYSRTFGVSCMFFLLFYLIWADEKL